MQVNIETQVVQDAIAKATADAIAGAIGAWDLRKKINDAANESIAKVDLPALVKAELDRVLAAQIDGLVRVAIEQAIPAVREAVAEGVTLMAKRMAFGLVAPLPNRTSYMGDFERSVAQAWDRFVAPAAKPTDETPATSTKVAEF